MISMKKIAILCIFAVLLGSTAPIYAADPNSTSGTQVVQNNDPQLYQDLNNIYQQVTQNPGQITNLFQNSSVQNQLQQWLQNPGVQSQIDQVLQNPTVQNDLNILFQNKNIKNDLSKIMNNSS